MRRSPLCSDLKDLRERIRRLPGESACEAEGGANIKARGES